MKILHIIPSLTAGGAEKLVLETCVQLNRISNIETKIITFKEDNSFSNKSCWEIISLTFSIGIINQFLLFFLRLIQQLYL